MVWGVGLGMRIKVCGYVEGVVGLVGEECLCVRVRVCLILLAELIDKNAGYGTAQL